MKKIFLQKLLLNSLLFLFFPLLLPAQNRNDSLKTYTMEEHVFIVSRHRQSLPDVGRNVTIIKQEEINKSQCHSLGDLLSSQAGMHITGSGLNYGSTERIFLRGANSYHTVILIDGVRISDPSSVDNGLDLSELSLNNIERIEIIKGSHSTLFGSSAIAGVINIITKADDTSGVHVNASLSAGSFGKKTLALNNNISVHLNHKCGLYLNIGANQTASSGLDATIDTVTHTSVFKNRDKDNYNIFNYNVKSGWMGKKSDVSVSYRHSSQYSDLDKAAFVDDDNRFIEFDRELFLWSASHHLSQKVEICYQGGYSLMKRRDNDDSSIVDISGNYDHQYVNSIFTGSYQNHELLSIFTLKHLDLVAGLVLSREKMNIYNHVYSNDPVFGLYESVSDLDSLDLQSNSKSFFIHGTLNGELVCRKLAAFSMGAGFRLLNHKRFGNVMTWEINPSFKINKEALIYYSFSSGFNEPSLYRLYSPDKGFGAVVSRGNVNLRPEKSLSHEIGIKGRFSQNGSYSISFFNTQINDLIEYVYLWDKAISIDSLGNNWMRNDYRGDTYVNISEQKITGVEMQFEAILSRSFRIRTGFTYFHGNSLFSLQDVDTSITRENHVQLFESGLFVSENKTEKNSLVRRPDAIVNLAIYWSPYRNLTLSFSNRFVGQRYDSYYNPVLGPYGAMDNKLINAYSVSNLQVSYTISKSLFVSMNIENIFNRNYMEIYGFTSRPRGVYLKLDYKFTK